ncbi:Putative beta-1,4-xylosyltransferase IRX14H [Glycine soja]|uniref:Glycosyltransferases n=1 Tax=Glycine soja TaxID=3848 RepID=A0A0B2PYR8_GLYSO|nr:Putative beta-1,4-xylosyltransferase IRX14H [Glycine soja]
MRAHRIIERIQREQRMLFGVKKPKMVIAVTPTQVRTFQKLHLSSVMHSLMLVPYDVVWIVVEAGRVTNETASIIAKSGLRTIHVGFNHRMTISWSDRHKLEAMMRLHALRIVRKERLDGIVIFADDSNMHTNNLVGWHTFNTLPYAGKSAVYIDDLAPVLPRKLEWAGFVLNSKLLWKDLDDKPEWIKDLEVFDGVDDIESPLYLLGDTSVVEPLGSCGRQVLLWWLRVEARTDSKFPAQWVIDPPLDITIPSKHTPWPDAPPQLPINEKELIATQERTTKHSTKTKISRSRCSRSKRKHDTKVIGVQVSTHSEQN